MVEINHTANPYPARLRFKPDNNLIFIFYLYGGSFLILFVIIRILLRNLPGDFEDFWIFFLRVERDYLFDGDVMLPLVAEIEEIIRSRAGCFSRSERSSPTNLRRSRQNDKQRGVPLSQADFQRGESACPLFPEHVALFLREKGAGEPDSNFTSVAIGRGLPDWTGCCPGVNYIDVIILW